MLLIIAVLSLCVIILYQKWVFSYWRKRGIPCVKPAILFGNMLPVIRSKLYLGIQTKMFYLYLRNLGYKHYGIYLMTSPRYFPLDNKIIKHILIQDFEYFNERGFYYNEKDDPLSANLFSLGGERWRSIRSKLTPAFTLGKIRFMFDTLLKCGYQLQEAVENISSQNNVIEITEISKCFSINVIGVCAFGVDCNCFENPNSDFLKFGKKTFDYTSWLRIFKMGFAFTLPELALKLGVQVFGKEYLEFFTNVVKKTIDYREKHNIVSKDLLQLLIELRNKWEKPTSIEELAAEVFIFFSAGFETTSTSLCYCLYELGLNPDIQKKVREEITTILLQHKDNITYESISDMTYMNQVIEETLRKYPPLAFIGRKCVKNYKVPDTEVVLEKGTFVDISILGIHHDPEYYPEPEKFDPERFSEKEKGLRRSCTYLPFGEGPRICIGMRFAIMELKVALTILLKQYEFSINNKTATPLEFEQYRFTLYPKNGVFMNIKKVL